MLTLQMTGCATENTSLAHTTAQSPPPAAVDIETAASPEPASELAEFPAAEAHTVTTYANIEPIDFGSGGEITVLTMFAGDDIISQFFKGQVARFNDKYAGKFKITLEPAGQGTIEQLERQDQLPPLIVDSFTNDWFAEKIIAKNKFYDLSPWLDQNPDIKARMITDSIAFNTTADGKLVSMPAIVMQPTGLFYNADMYKAPKPLGQMNMDEFAASLGDNKIAFTTAYDARDTMFFTTALIAGQPGGAELLKSYKNTVIKDFSNPIFINAFAQLQKFLQQHSMPLSADGTTDTLTAFMKRDASIYCNEFSMGQMFMPMGESNWSNGFNGAQVKADVFPGNIVLGNVDGYSYWIPNSARQDQIDCALAFMSYRCSQEETEAFILAFDWAAPFMPLSDGFKDKAKDKPLLLEIDSSMNKDTIIVPMLRDKMVNSVSNRSFGELLSGLADGSSSPEEFAKQLSDISTAACDTC